MAADTACNLKASVCDELAVRLKIIFSYKYFG